MIKEIIFAVLLLLLTGWLVFLLGLFWHKLSIKKPLIVVWILQFILAIASLVIALELLGILGIFSLVIGILFILIVLFLTHRYRSSFNGIISDLIDFRY